MPQTVKNPPAMWETWVYPGLGRSPGGEHGNPLLPKESLWTEELGGLQSLGEQRVGLLSTGQQALRE